MPKTIKKVLQEEYNRLKKVFDKLLSPKKEQATPPFALQPIRKKNIEGYHLR